MLSKQYELKRHVVSQTDDHEATQLNNRLTERDKEARNTSDIHLGERVGVWNAPRELAPMTKKRTSSSGIQRQVGVSAVRRVRRASARTNFMAQHRLDLM